MIVVMIRVTSFVRHLLRVMLLGGLTHATHALAADVYVIAHPGVVLSADTIRDIYIGEKQFAEGVKLVPVDNAAMLVDFLGNVLKLDQTRYANLWVKKSFRDALNPPALRTSDNEIIAYVRKTPGAVAYIGAPPPTGITLVQKF